MNLFFEYFSQDPHFFTMFFLLSGAFLVGIFYFHQADKEWERRTASEWDDLTNSYADLHKMFDIPNDLRTGTAIHTTFKQD